MIEDIIRSRGIEEVVHFTTENGLVGILDSGYLRSRQRISRDQRLEFILKNNSNLRKDTDWIDYVNLSVTDINKEFFRSSTRWHAESSWRILSFSPEILCHAGVEFCTTNNIYPVVKRGQGEDGLESIFSARVPWGYYGTVACRTSEHPAASPTHIQAEVLYPCEISISYLRRIYVISGKDQDDVSGVISALNVSAIDVIVAPEKFGIK